MIKIQRAHHDERFREGSAGLDPRDTNGSRGEKLGIARLDLNDRIAEAVEKADLDPDQIALLGKLLGYLIR
jgi:hypothetical protein